MAGLVGVVLEREEELEEERPDLDLTGRSPLVDLLSRSETGAGGRKGKSNQSCSLKNVWTPDS